MPKPTLHLNSFFAAVLLAIALVTFANHSVARGLPAINDQTIEKLKTLGTLSDVIDAIEGLLSIP